MPHRLYDFNKLIDMTPNFQLFIVDQNFKMVDLEPLKSLVHELVVIERSYGAREFRITFNDPDGNVNEINGQTLFREGLLLFCALGWGNMLHHKGACEIVEINTIREVNSTPKIEIVALDRIHRMMAAEDTDKVLKDTRTTIPGNRDEIINTPPPITPRTYKNRHDHDILECVLGHYDFDWGDGRGKYFVDRTIGKHDRVLAKGTSGYQFVQEIADYNNLYLWCDLSMNVEITPPKFRWRAFAVSVDKVLNRSRHFRYKYADENRKSPLLSFISNRDARDLPSEIEVFGFSTRDGKRIKYKRSTTSRKPEQRLDVTDVRVVSGEAVYDRKTPVVRRDIVRGRDIFTIVPNDSVKNPAQVIFNAFGRRVEVYTDQNFRNKEDAERFAEQYARARVRDFMSANCSTVGNPFLSCRQMHHFSGLSKDENGYWEFTEVRHTINESGYVNEIECRRAINENTFDFVDDASAYKGYDLYDNVSLLAMELPPGV